MNPWLAIACVAVTASLVMVILWIVQKRTADAGLVDVGWSAGVGASALFLSLALDGDPTRRLLVGILGTVWGLRLAGYLFVDRVRRGEEDGRYQNLREHWGEKAQPYFFLFFQAQALFVILFCVPFLVVANTNAAIPIPWAVAGVAIWLLSVGGEALADSQLAKFRADPENRGKTCRRGLWRYSRHPNYFFEWVHWWSYVALAVGSDYFWISLGGPIVMGVFLFKLTGIPYTEKRALESRGDDYREYQRTTSVFFPWFPKESAGTEGAS